MRIAVIHYDARILGGAERVLTLFSKLASRGFKVTIFTSFISEQVRRELNGQVKIVAVGGIEPKRLGKGYTEALNTYSFTARALKKHEYDLYIFNTSYHLAGTFKPSLAYVHFPFAYTVSGYFRRILHAPLDKAERGGLRKATVIAANSCYTKVHVKKFTGRSDIKVVYPCIDVAKFTPNPYNGKFLLSVNRFVPYKRLEFALEVLKELRKRKVDVKLKFVGGLDYRFLGYVHYLISLARKWGLSRQVEFEFNVSEDRLKELYSNSLLVLYTSPGEHFGIVPLEAMASAKPVIAVNFGGPAETIVNGVTGYTLPMRAEIWADAVEDLLRNEEKRVKMGVRAREHVEKNFNSETFIASIASLIKSI